MRRSLLHFALQFFEQKRVGFEFLENEGEHLEGLAADVVLHAFDVAVNGVGIEPEAGEETGEDVVAVGDGLADGAAVVGEGDAAVALVNEEAFSVELLDHGGDAGLGNAEIGGDVHDAGVAFEFDEVVNLLQIVLHSPRLGGGLCGQGDARGGWHGISVCPSSDVIQC